MGREKEPEPNYNEELTIEGMFQVFDKDAGTFMDVREILDIREEEFKENNEIVKILRDMNSKNPVQSYSQNDFPQAISSTFASAKVNSYLKKTDISPSALETGGNNMSEEQRQNAIMANRMTQFSTLNVPSFLDDFGSMDNLSSEQKKQRMTQMWILQNKSWQDWWELKMNRNTELIKAIIGHQVQRVKDLLNDKKYQDYCADVNFQNPRDMKSPLHIAVDVQDLEIVKILTNKFAELNAVDSKKQTPLHIACQLANFDIVK